MAVRVLSNEAAKRLSALQIAENELQTTLVGGATVLIGSIEGCQRDGCRPVDHGLHVTLCGTVYPKHLWRPCHLCTVGSTAPKWHFFAVDQPSKGLYLLNCRPL